MLIWHNFYRIPSNNARTRDIKHSTKNMHVARPTITAYIICKNEEGNIRRCLESVTWCDEIVVVDSGSSDSTIEICKEFTSSIYSRAWEGYGPQKNFALSKCHSEWVLNLDADEEVSEELRDSIVQIIGDQSNGEISGYFFLRVVRFLDRWWYAGDWYPEYRLRLGKRGLFRWTTEPVHERAVIEGRSRRIAKPLFHYTYTGLEHQINRINNYSTLTSSYKGTQYALNSLSFRLWLIGTIIIRPLLRFIRFYLIRGGFLYGTAGLIVATNDAFYVFLKYAKLWELAEKARTTQNAKVTTQVPPI